MSIITYPGMENVTGVYEVLDTANSYTGYLMGPVALITIFVLLMMIFMSRPDNNSAASITASLWVTTLAAIMLSLVPNMLNNQYAVFMMIATALSTIFLWRRRRMY